MWPVIPPSYTLAIIAVMGGLVLVATRWIQPAWWRLRPLRIGVLVTFGAMLFGVALWAIGSGIGRLALVHAGAGVAYTGVLVLLPAAVVLPVSAALDRGLLWALARRRARKSAATVIDAPRFDAATVIDAPRLDAATVIGAPRARLTRRAIIGAGAATLPVMAAAGSARGFAEATRDPVVPIVRMPFPALHPDLEGLQILHLSDLHLGACRTLADLDRALRVARDRHRPDLIVLTGDLADDPALIPGALRLIHDARPPHGALASLGNHEYLHDIAVTRPKFEASPIPLLVGTGRTVRIGRAKLFVGGADDPVHMGGDIPWLLRPSIEAAAKHAPRDADFRLLLCHRPEGFGPATDNGFDLTLSGHTHGGQIGLFGRSLLEKLRPEVPWWGAYARKRVPRDAKAGPITKGPSRLYTTSGFGHWFPFRVGCPTEMPMIVLTASGGTKATARRVV